MSRVPRLRISTEATLPYERVRPILSGYGIALEGRGQQRRGIISFWTFSVFLDRVRDYSSLVFRPADGPIPRSEPGGDLGNLTAHTAARGRVFVPLFSFIL